MKAIVNEGCIGCGLCASTCPAVFTLEDGVAVAMAGDIPEEELPAAAEARDGCPVSVIDIQADGRPAPSRSSGPKNRIAPLRRPAMRFLPVCGRAFLPIRGKMRGNSRRGRITACFGPACPRAHCSSFSRSSLLYVSGSSRRGP